jgi:hypothetical protein
MGIIECVNKKNSWFNNNDAEILRVASNYAIYLI